MTDAAAFATAPYEEMGASLLARTPVRPTKKPKDVEKKEIQVILNHCESSLNSMRNWRYSWWAYWSELARFILPKRYHWVVTPNRMSKGAPINDAIIDSTATLAAQTCASGMWAGLTNPARPWLKLAVALPWVQIDAEGKAWLEDTEERLYTILAQSNFYTEMAQVFEDLTVFGTAPFIIYEDHEEIIRVYTPCAGEYFLRTGARMSVDTFCREFVLTVEQIVEQFGLDECPINVQKLWSEGGASLDNEFVVCQLVEPNFDIDDRSGGKVAIVPKAFTYREIYWLKGQKSRELLSRRGFHVKPFMAMRWSKTSNDPYGRSPGMDALGDIKQIQMETREKAEFIKKLTKPPMIASPELKNEPQSIWPGHITYAINGGNIGFKPAFEVSAPALTPLVADIEKISERINRTFFVDVFMAITQMQGVQPRNELELTKRDLERLQRLGTTIDLAEIELKAAIERVLDIMQRRKILKPMPKSLAGVPLKIEFINLPRIAQRSSRAVAMKDFLATMGGLSSAAKAAGVPDPLRVVNLDKSAREFADVTDYPIACLFTDDEVAQHDHEREKAMQAAQAPQQAMAAVNAAKTLSQTQVAPGNALGALTGAPQQP